jgi:hypothetical protein
LRRREKSQCRRQESNPYRPAHVTTFQN